MNTFLDKLFGPVPVLPGPTALDADRRAGWAIWTCAICIVLLVFQAGIDLDRINPDWARAGSRTLQGRADWLVAGFVYYLLVPLAIVALVFREPPSRYGMRIHFTRRSLVLYGIACIAMLPLLYWVSNSPSFLASYPMARDIGDDGWLILLWESMRGLRFIALEFFFRGFLLFSLEARLGYNAIAVAALPYGLLHYGKPFPEAMGAIVAGAVLGMFALRTRSIAGGALLHIFVATTMDLLALWRVGAFG